MDQASNPAGGNKESKEFSIISSSTICPQTMIVVTTHLINGSSDPFTFDLANTQALNTNSGNNV